LKEVDPVKDVGVVKPSEFIKEHEGRLKEADIKGVDIWDVGQLHSYGY
jgi:hypothetical protein